MITYPKLVIKYKRTKLEFTCNVNGDMQ